MRATTMLLALFLTWSALAEGTRAHIVPFGPTSATPIDVHFPLACHAPNPVVTRNGSRITVSLGALICPPVESIETQAIVRLPELLPPGEYHLEVVTTGQSAPVASLDFVVRNGGAIPFEIHPFAVPASGTDLRLRLTGVSCGTADCSDVIVKVDGATAGPLEKAADGAIWFTAPDHGEGLVDVTVQEGDAVSLSRAALYYFLTPEHSVFETILFPVLYSVSGAYGSRWVSEAVYSNPSPWFVENANTFQPVRPCLVYPCGERLHPGELGRVSDGFPHGFGLQVPRPEAPGLAFGLRVRDISRQNEGFGTEIPVVREKDLFHGTAIPLLNVPADPRYRVKVRVYSVQPFVTESQRAALVSRTRGSTDIGKTMSSAMTRSCPYCGGEPDFNEFGLPYFAEFDLPSGASGERVDVYVSLDGDSTGWAFATVTNNETQQVTIVTPNGKGGVPCATCTVP